VWSAVQSNFDGAPELRAMLQDAPRFGNDDPQADGIARRVRDLCLCAARAAEPEGGRLRILTGFYSWNAHNWAGADMGATPDGRLAGQPLAHGANPAAGRATRGPTALARSMAAIQPGTGASAPLHLELDPSLYRGQRGVGLFRSFVNSYFGLGGTQLVVNCVSRATLEHAIAHPEAHRDLVIRVTGFSAYFVNLDPRLYPEILSRYDGSEADPA
jgi:formate C-acetyltransferase